MASSLLIVDDSSTMRKIIMRTIRMSGVKFDNVEEAGDGMDGFTKLSGGSYDVVLCDVNMPEMNGLEMVKKVRTELPACNKTKIIMVTTESSQDFVCSAMKSGADGYVTKPFTPEKFQKKLVPILG